MTYRKRFTVFSSALLAGLLLLLSACSSAAESVETDLPPLQIGGIAWVGSGPMYIADAKGFFEHEGVEVDFTLYDVYEDGLAAFAQRELDGFELIMSDGIAQVAAGVPAQVVWVEDSSLGADVVVGKPGLSDPEDLRGARVGLSFGTSSHLFVVRGLANYGLTESDFSIVNLPGENVPAALKADEIDAGFTWDPHLAEVLDEGGEVLFDTSETPGLIVDVLMFRTEAIEQRPDDIAAAVRALARGADFWRQNPEEANMIVAEAIGENPEDIPLFVDGLELYALEDNLEAFNIDTEGTKSLYESGRFSLDLFLTSDIIEQELDIETLINPMFVQAAAGE